MEIRFGQFRDVEKRSSGCSEMTIAGGRARARQGITVIAAVIVIVGATGYAVMTYPALIGGSNYSVEDTGAHASEYGDMTEEGHGRMIALLWTTYGLMLAWTVYYLIRHWHEFSASTSG